MTLIAIELEDVGIRVARGSGDSLLTVDGQHRSSPGYAWIGPTTIRTGLAGAQHASLHPLDVDSRFWDQLDTEPATRSPKSPNRAEVACAHLEHVLRTVEHGGDDFVIAVSPAYGRRQLGILVSIARELKLSLQGVVAAPVALPSAAHGSVIVVQLGLHRCVLSAVEASEAGVALGTVRVCPEVGLRTLERQWIKVIGDEFVRTTRFDPLHDAATEQALQDRMPSILDALADEGRMPLELRTSQRAHHVTLTGQMLASAVHPLLLRLVGEIHDAQRSAQAATILLTHETARVAGLSSMLRQQVATPVRVLDAGAAALGLLELWPGHFDQSVAPAVGYHTRRLAAATTPARSDAEQPS